MSRNVTVDEMASAIAEELEKYNDLAADELKKAVKKAGRTAKSDINEVWFLPGADQSREKQILRHGVPPRQCERYGNLYLFRISACRCG